MKVSLCIKNLDKVISEKYVIFFKHNIYKYIRTYIYIYSDALSMLILYIQTTPAIQP